MAKKSAIKLLSHISKILGVSPVLPGENSDLYESGLVATIEELEAKTPLQIYLAEKIFGCLWWIGRYEEQKRAVLISEMVNILDSRRGVTLEISDFKNGFLMNCMQIDRVLNCVRRSSPAITA